MQISQFQYKLFRIGTTLVVCCLLFIPKRCFSQGFPVSGSVEISTSPERAQYTLANEKLGIQRQGTTPQVLVGLAPGQYLLNLHLSGWKDYRQIVTLNGATSKVISWQFSSGQLIFKSKPAGIQVSTNGNSLGKTPMSVTLPVGFHKFTYQYPGFPTQERDVEVLKDKAAQVEIEFTTANGAIPNRLNLPKAIHSLKGANFYNTLGMKMNWVQPIKAWADAYLVTQPEYESVMGNNPSEYNGNRLPVESVSWYNAKEFCAKLTSSEHQANLISPDEKYDLPSDNQWSVLVADASLDDAITSLHTTLTHTFPVGTKKPNKYGLFDMRGNVWEWCLDWYTNSMNTPENVEKFHLQDGGGAKLKVLRGGAWYINSSICLGAFYRISYPPNSQFKGFGFRCVLEDKKLAQK